MTRLLTKTTFTVGLLFMLMALPALGATVNKSVKIEANSEASGALVRRRLCHLAE